MSKRMWTCMVLGALCMQGCSGTVPASHQDVRLFAADGSARFSLYVTCSSHTTSCQDAAQPFRDWADGHHVAIHMGKASDMAFRKGVPSPAGEQDRPYRVAITYQPDVTDSIAPGHVVNAAPAGGIYRPQVAYQAWVSIYDARTGLPVKRTAYLHDAVAFEHGWGAIDSYVAMYARDVISHVDPSYAAQTAASP